MASWKIHPNPSEYKVEHTPFLQSRKFFAVDDSGSTAGAIIKSEQAFVERLHNKFGNPRDAISLWGSDCDAPTTQISSVYRNSKHGGTRPCEILKQAAALKKIKRSDVWFLVTDGEIGDSDVHAIAELAYDRDVLNVPIVFLIVGSRGRSPETTNISVGISFFASSQDTLILFKETETGRIFVIAGKGCFAPLGRSAAARDLRSWTDIPVFADEDALFGHCHSLSVKVLTAKSRATRPRGVSLGPEWEKTQEGPTWVDLDALLQAGQLSDADLFELLAEDAFDVLAVAYKTRKRIPEIRSFVKSQRIEQVSPKLEDVAGAAAIVAKMGQPSITDADRKTLQTQLRDAHIANRESYQRTIVQLAESPEVQRLRRRNKLVASALRVLASIEAANFDAEILSRRSHRARRAEVVSSDNTVAMATLDLEGPSFRGCCFICCGEDEVMSICIKELDERHLEDNTTNFALNYPLAAGASPENVNSICSQNVCFQCALLGPSGMSIYKEKLKAIIPAVRYEGSNKAYINDQLYLALTAGLATGAAGIAQLFMAILNEILRTKSWAGAHLRESQLSNDEQQEAMQRRQTFRWMLDQLVENTLARRTFTEIGDWVKFPYALTWAAGDFAANDLTSFAVTYPVDGFRILLSIGVQTGAFSEQVSAQIRKAKVVYSVAAKYLSDMQAAIRRGDTGNEWKRTYLEMMYQSFNAPLVPRYLGSDSIITNAEAFRARLSACLTSTGSSHNLEHTQDTHVVMGKVQVLLFWLISKQKSHCTAQTFFTRLSHEEHLAGAVLNPALSVPEYEVRTLLLSIFAKEQATLIDDTAATMHTGIVPFKTPFGPSVIRCGFEACGERFCTSDSLRAAVADIPKIRQARARHLIRAFGVRGRFENAVTGLPERPAYGEPPSSLHTNIHINVTRSWAEQSRETRRAFLDDENRYEGFVREVRSRICEQGRGDIFNHRLDKDIRAVLPSFFAVLAEALRRKGDSDADITLYEHDFDQNKMESKIRYEMAAWDGDVVMHEVLS
ncbi:hypothetical protein BDV95DRAFT_572859 [Massariosphaeria phaeospora]|uniref:VWFA domain-containing protein n=1 Tax=Massariosphaeria phaeospora TaxID=100035 RepID=A0A7C8M6A2_9PLEO|nr:hypothetical protein BDV95DRAFT_572859 [Massariosphaeria phaeospora]